MDETSKQQLEVILAKPVSSLSEFDKSFLRSRESYLNDMQREFYKDALSETAADSDAITAEGLDKAGLAQLKKIAKDQEIDIAGLKTAEEIREAIKEVLFPTE